MSKTKLIEVDKWRSVHNADGSWNLPEHLETVWLYNENTGWVALGCYCEDSDGWYWATSNGTIYSEEGKIIAECEGDDYVVTHWHRVPELPKIINSGEKV